MEFCLEARTTFAKWKAGDELGSPSKRQAKIFSNRLPRDFFGSRLYAHSQQKKRQSSREQMQTQKVNRRPLVTERISETRELPMRNGNLTTRLVHQGMPPSNTMNLIMGIIQSSRQMNKQISRHSIQLRRSANLVNSPQALAFQLPPLRLRKGISLN